MVGESGIDTSSEDSSNDGKVKEEVEEEVAASDGPEAEKVVEGENKEGNELLAKEKEEIAVKKAEGQELPSEDKVKDEMSSEEVREKEALGEAKAKDEEKVITYLMDTPQNPWQFSFFIFNNESKKIIELLTSILKKIEAISGRESEGEE